MSQELIARGLVDRELFSRGAYVPPSFSPPIPRHLTLDARSISSRFPLRRESGAHRLEIGPLLLTYVFSEGTYVSIYDVSPLDGSPTSAISIDSRPPLLHSKKISLVTRVVTRVWLVA